MKAEDFDSGAVEHQIIDVADGNEVKRGLLDAIEAALDELLAAMEAGAILANLDLQISAKRGDSGYEVTLDSEMQLGVDELDVKDGGTA